MFTVVDLGYFEIRSGSNWICWGKLGAIEFSEFGGLWGWDVRSHLGCSEGRSTFSPSTLIRSS
ncbi:MULTISPECIES: hypothetical protein [unclassified Microcoleus]|uniref:hypothetical protein n=1 Tax=unclassified Microcoleus TaxID=2642155 RepID=UPI002FD055C6